MKKYSCTICLLFCVSIHFVNAQNRWSEARANEWYAKQPWLVGANFTPSTAINQLEFWQADSFDTATIDNELGFAQGIGMNVMRVFFHYLLWQQDSSGFINRVNTYLTISNKHHIKTIFVLFDDCWNETATLGKQPNPKPGVHNSGWLQCPGKSIHNNPSQWSILERYTKGIVHAFAKDKRILLWDLYNEPGNTDYNLQTLPLLTKVEAWARAAKPTQPLSIGVWNDNKEFADFEIAHSDVITFHNYDDTAKMLKQIKELRAYGRPVICTEYMARKNNSLFLTHLPVLKREKVGAINWGLVKGKTNTIYPWGSKEGSPEPTIWFHDVFRPDGSPFDNKETSLIRKLSSVNKLH